MRKFLKWTAIIVAVLVVGMLGAYQFMKVQTKKASPEVTAAYSKDGQELSVFYCSPSKKGREVFGALVPYEKVWRTGANEATTFTSNKGLQINGKSLPAGKYTLWTIPDKEEWTIIWNSKEYGWGVDFGGQALREPEADVLQIKVPVQNADTSVEQFTISFEETDPLALVFAWDKTKVSVPLK